MRGGRAFVAAACLAGLLAVGLRLAWIGDDACITLRTVENWLRGDGLRWNVADRVQTYTHPLWMLLLAAGRWCSGESYFAAIALGLALSCATAALLLRAASTVPAMLAVAAILALARAFGDYMTSGLETPLVGLLLVVFARTATLGGAVAIAALLALTRLDLVLLAAPLVVARLRGGRPADLARTLLLGGWPLLAWLAFAAVYYGSPWPITAHAKAFGLGIPAGELAQQGLRYLAFALATDPLLVLVVAAGLVLGLWRSPTRWLAAGALLYVGYVVKVGGDFMAGRFLLPPFVVAMTVLARWLGERPGRVAAIAFGAAVAVAGAAGLPAWLRPPGSEVAPTDEQIEAQHGIADERRVYYAQLGLFAPGRTPPQFGSMHALVRPGGGPRWLLLNGAVGGAGFAAGRDGHIVDALLCDPLIARLPARDPARWRIGHVLRRIPEGYYETLATGENHIVHPGLRRYVDALRTVTQAPVFAGERLATLWRFARGEFDADLRAFVAEHYRTPPRLPVAAAELPPPLPLGAFWFDEPRVRLVYDGGLAIAFAAPQHASRLDLQVLGVFVDYRVRFVRAGAVFGEATVELLPPPAGLTPLQAAAGLRAGSVAVPASVGDFDALWLDFVETPMSNRAPGPAGIGALTLR